MGALSFICAWETHCSNSVSVAWRKIAFWSASGSLLNIATSLGVLIIARSPTACRLRRARSDWEAGQLGRSFRQVGMGSIKELNQKVAPLTDNP
jgi:hypothetical protein